jgi:glutathione S-transferase
VAHAPSLSGPAAPACGLIRKGNGISGPESVADGACALDEALDFVAVAVGDTGYLVGSRFTIADLAAAATLASIVDPADSPMTRPRPAPPGLDRRLRRVAGHPAIGWAHGNYRLHRSARAGIDGEVDYC